MARRKPTYNTLFEKRGDVSPNLDAADAAEAYIVVRVGRIVVVPIRNGAVVGIVVPATAAFHTVGPAC